MFKKIYIFLIISFLFSFKLYAQDIQKDLLDLKNLFEAGVLNEEEYNSARKIIEEKGYKEKVIESKKKIEIKKEEIKITKEVEKTKEDLSAKEIEKNRKKRIQTLNKKIKFALEEEKNDPYCEIVEKKQKDKNVNFCLKNSDILMLGRYEKFQTPKFILDTFKGCQTEMCVRQRAGKKVYEYFVRREEIYHVKYPGAMIEGMAWFEIFYLDMLKKNQKYIEEYFSKNGNIKKSKQKKLYSLIKTNKGRIKMREALGFTVYDDIYDVIEGEWLLAEFLNKDKLKASKVKMSDDMKKKKLLIEKYKATLAKYKKKLEEEKKIK